MVFAAHFHPRVVPKRHGRFLFPAPFSIRGGFFVQSMYNNACR
jgi:hypothetical protein